MKNVAIILLICINVGLILTLVAVAAVSSAAAQEGYFPSTNYIMVTGQIESGYEVIYIIDMASQRLGAWKYDLSTKKLRGYRGQKLKDDFRTSGR
ncbi:hypothetical protein LCGC14_0095790 [marine sediment metagenome]|uniref:Uncharacterized protein n=1 Tax=marine sediment metagenome TaxID=412755 RepID=A0A0F9VER3_9ZZZZ|nr:hypothetical protein [Phycisphaerae bacterium]HDZ43626.1 hypothetical protein [Phycisphaerae bacterium]